MKHSWSEDDDRRLSEYARKYEGLTKTLERENTISMPLSLWTDREEKFQAVEASMQCWRAAAIVAGGCAVVLAVCFVWAVQWALSR